MSNDIFPFQNDNGPLEPTLSQEIKVGNERTDEVTSALLELLSQLKSLTEHEHEQK